MTRRNVETIGRAGRGLREASAGRRRAVRAGAPAAVAVLAATILAAHVGAAAAVTEPPWRIDRMSQPRASLGGDPRLRGEIAELRGALQARDAESQAMLAQIDRTIAAATHRFAASLEDAQAASARIVARFEMFATALIAVIAVLCAWIMRLQQRLQLLERRRGELQGQARLAAAVFDPYAASAERSSAAAAAACVPVSATRLPRGGPTTRPAARRGGGSD